MSGGGPAEVIRPGDRVVFEPGEEHRRRPTADRLMAHLAMVEVDAGGNSATRGDRASDDGYGG